MKNFLVVGGGGREHALAWALSRSEMAASVHAAPGNPGIGQCARLHPVSALDFESLLPIVKENAIDLVVVGPEAPLADGLADSLRAEGILVFGPGRAGAMLEASKVYAKRFMDRHGIPTAAWDLCSTVEEAERAVAKRTAPYIVKADGLAAGKGVSVTASAEEALAAARAMIEEGLYGESGRQVIVEDGLEGEELTVLAITDGKTCRILPPSQDHKRVFDDDKGPNTGGMGAYAPVPWAGPSLMEKIRNRVIEPTLRGLREEGIPYCGVLYAGLMIGPDGEPRVIEYNVRFGDPEAQAVIPLLEGDFGRLLTACCEGRLSEVPWKDSGRWAANVVLASGGYPGPFEKGMAITGLEEIPSDGDLLVFHGGTALDSQGRPVTAGGRVLSAVGLGDTLEEAIAGAYGGASRISFKNMHYRKDIGRKAFMKRSDGK